MVVWAARKLGRPVKWTAERSESFMSRRPRARPRHPRRAGAGRGRHVPRPPGAQRGQPGRLPLDLRARHPDLLHATLLAGVYKTPAIYCEVLGRLHQHRPGRRLPRRRAARGDLPARAAGRRRRARDRHRPLELRRRNFIRPDQFPYQTPVALQYDSGDYAATLDLALKAADWAGFEERRAEAQEARQAARHRHLHLHRGLRHRAVGGGRRARRARRPLRGGQRPRPPDRQGVDLHRHPQPRPGPRDHLRPDRRRPAGRAGGAGRGRARRHRQDPVRHGHLRLALARGRRLGHRQGRSTRSSTRARKIAAHLLEAAEATSSSRTASSR